MSSFWRICLYRQITGVPRKPFPIFAVLQGPTEESEREVKEKSEKVGLKLNIQKTKVMASGPITS